VLRPVHDASLCNQTLVGRPARQLQHASEDHGGNKVEMLGYHKDLQFSKETITDCCLMLHDTVTAIVTDCLVHHQVR
jgi:hypothetical protein